MDGEGFGVRAVRERVSGSTGTMPRRLRPSSVRVPVWGMEMGEVYGCNFRNYLIKTNKIHASGNIDHSRRNAEYSFFFQTVLCV